MSGKKTSRSAPKRKPTTKKEPKTQPKTQPKKPSSSTKQKDKESASQDKSALPLKQKRQQFQRRKGPAASELTLIEEIVELSAEEMIVSGETGEILRPKAAQLARLPKAPKKAKAKAKTSTKAPPKSTKKSKSSASGAKASQGKAAKPTRRRTTTVPPPSPPTPLPKSSNPRPSPKQNISLKEQRAPKGSKSPLETGIGVQPQLTETASHFLFPEEPLTTPESTPSGTTPLGPDTAPEIAVDTTPDNFQTIPDVKAVSPPKNLLAIALGDALEVPQSDTQDDLTPLTEEDAISLLEVDESDDEALPPAPIDAREDSIDARLQRIDLARNNYKLLKQHLQTQSTDQLCLDDMGRLATSAASAATIVVPQRRGQKLVSLCIPTGLAKDEDEQLCEAYLVLRKLPNEAPVWSHALASLQATEERGLHFIEWATVKEEMLLLLNEEQREHLIYLLAPEFSAILQDPLYPPDDKKSPRPLRLKPTPLPMQAPQRPQKAAKTPAVATNKARRTGQSRKTLEYQKHAPKGASIEAVEEVQEGIHIDVTAAPRKPRRVSDDTAVRKIQLKTAPLDPDALQLHINIPGSLHGKGFQPIEELLHTIGDKQELKLPLLGLKIQFTYNRGDSGKVFPRIIVTRSTNVRNIQYAAYDIQLFANKNPKLEARFDHVQELPRGHMASIDLSPTDQLRGVMLLVVTPPQSKAYSETIHCSWSVVE